MKTTAIIQARMGSKRLPGKVLLKILGKTVLGYVIERVKRSGVDEVIVATSIKDEDAQIADIARCLGVGAYRGSDEDVLDRYYQAAKACGAAHIVRITADCPLIDPYIIYQALKFYFKSGADYCSNALERTFPDGLDMEVFRFDPLKDAWRNADLLSEREHVTTYIIKNGGRFKLVNFRNKIDLSGKRWTLDREEDYKFIKAVIEGIYPIKPDFHMDDVLDFLKDNPELEDINKDIIPAEGYLKSLKEDRKVDIEHCKE